MILSEGLGPCAETENTTRKKGYNATKCIGGITIDKSNFKQTENGGFTFGTFLQNIDEKKKIRKTFFYCTNA